MDFNNERCIGCKACMQACPYDALYIDPESNTAAKCNFCTHRLEVGLEPSCVVVCPERAIIPGDLDDPTSEISQLINRFPTQVRKPEKGTKPKLYYIDGDEAALVPSAAKADGQYLWSGGPELEENGRVGDGETGRQAPAASSTSSSPPLPSPRLPLFPTRAASTTFAPANRSGAGPSSAISGQSRSLPGACLLPPRLDSLSGQRILQACKSCSDSLQWCFSSSPECCWSSISSSLSGFSMSSCGPNGSRGWCAARISLPRMAPF